MKKGKTEVKGTMEFVEIDGIKWFPEVVKKMRLSKFIEIHLIISPFNKMDEETAKNKLETIYKKIK